MKTKHENISLIEDYIVKNNLEINFSDDFVRKVYKEVLEEKFLLKDLISKSKIDKYYSIQYDFLRRDLLKVKFRINNSSAKGIKEGFVYCITNKAWPSWYKIGSAIDVYERLMSYQTSSPLRDYELKRYFFTLDRFAKESELRENFQTKNNEWCFSEKESDVLSIFEEESKISKMYPSEQEILDRLIGQIPKDVLKYKDDRLTLQKAYSNVRTLFIKGKYGNFDCSREDWYLTSSSRIQRVYKNKKNKAIGIIQLQETNKKINVSFKISD